MRACSTGAARSLTSMEGVGVTVGELLLRQVFEKKFPKRTPRPEARLRSDPRTDPEGVRCPPLAPLACATLACATLACATLACATLACATLACRRLFLSASLLRRLFRAVRPLPGGGERAGWHRKDAGGVQRRQAAPPAARLAARRPALRRRRGGRAGQRGRDGRECVRWIGGRLVSPRRRARRAVGRSEPARHLARRAPRVAAAAAVERLVPAVGCGREGGAGPPQYTAEWTE